MQFKHKYVIHLAKRMQYKIKKIVIGNLSFENVETFKYLRVTVANTNDIREDIKAE